MELTDSDLHLISRITGSMELTQHLGLQGAARACRLRRAPSQRLGLGCTRAKANVRKTTSSKE